jgi:hypothetical protein
MAFSKVTPVSIQAFVEGLLRLTNVLEATNETLKNVNNICTLAINSAKYFVLFSGCSLQYVGESKQPFHKRLNGHRSDLRKSHFFL